TYKDATGSSYTLNVTRMSQVDLATLAVTGTVVPTPLLSPSFRPLTTAYTLAAVNSEGTITFAATAASGSATVSYSPAATLNVASLAVSGSATVTITVTVPGGASRAYTVAVTRSPIGFALDTTWGTAGRLGPDINGTTKLYNPSALATGGGRVYIHDNRNFRIQDVTPSGNTNPWTWNQRWGSNGSGSGQFNDTRGGGLVYYAGYLYDQNGGRIQKFAASNGAFVTSFGSVSSESPLAFDPSGNLYCADTYNNRVLKFDTSGNQILAWNTNANANAIAADAAHVYVGENNQVEVFSPTGTLQTTWINSKGIPRAMTIDVTNATVYIAWWSEIDAQAAGTGSWSPVVLTGGTFNSISGIAIVGTNFYVLSGADYRCYQYTINTTTHALSLAGSDGADLTTFPGMKSPARVSLNGSYVYVADSGNNRVLKLSAASGSLAGTLTSSLYPQGLAIDSANSLIYVAETSASRVAEYNLGSLAYVSSLTGMGNVCGVAVDASGKVYVADYNAGTVSMYNSSWVQQGSSITGFNHPRGVTVDTAQNVYVADCDNHCIKKYSPNMASLLQVIDGKGHSILDVSVGPSGIFAATGDYQMLQYDANGAYVTGFPASGSFGISGAAQNISGVAQDAAGKLYFTDSNDCSVKRYTPQ
ncbi:MAG TPA: NHL repeat-containing protein, partial [Spirochaetia bacterium]|nr:NHL repeat-containing protein [Spirochaetia bacterium]